MNACLRARRDVRTGLSQACHGEGPRILRLERVGNDSRFIVHLGGNHSIAAVANAYI